MSNKAFLKRFVLLVSVPLLPLSIGFLAVGITLFMLGNLPVPRFFFSIPTIVSGIVLWYAGLYLENRMRFFFAGAFLVLTGALLVLIDIGIVRVHLPSVWPVLMLFVGISFSAAGFLNYRKLLAVYLAPAFVFAGLGFFFLLFTTRVIKISFTTVVLWWFPFLLIPSLISFIVWVFQKGRKDRAGDE